MNIELDVNLPKNLKSKFNTILNRYMKLANKQIVDILINDVDSVKRYTDRTGKLTNAITTKISDNEIMIYIDESKADYAEYVYKGHGSWKADKFLEKSLEKNKDKIYKIVKLAINKAIVEFNRS